MKNRNYTIKRENIYVGRVVKLVSPCIEQHKIQNKSEVCPSGTVATCTKPYRSMLFVPTEEGFAEDLLYDSPSYPIMNIASPKACSETPDRIVISECCRLAKLLQYLGYDRKLSFNDLVTIRNTIFTNQWAENNCRLFGFKEIKPDLTKDISKAEIKRELSLYKRDKSWGMRNIVKNEDGTSLLPEEYLYALSSMRDSNIREAIIDAFFGIPSRRNAFKPHKDEDVKSLTMIPIKKIR